MRNKFLSTLLLGPTLYTEGDISILSFIGFHLYITIYEESTLSDEIWSYHEQHAIVLSQGTATSEEASDEEKCTDDNEGDDDNGSRGTGKVLILVEICQK